MTWYLVRRILAALIVLLLMTIIVFFLGHALIAGNEASALTGPQATKAEVHALEQSLGLNRPLTAQYFHWLTGAVRGNLGTSTVSGQRISSIIVQEAPVSLELAILSLIIATLIGIPAGVSAAVRQGRLSDLLMRVPLMVLMATPVFISGTLALFAAARWIPSIYSAQYVPLTTNPTQNLHSMLLPMLSAGLPTAALVAQMTRATMIDVLAEQHVVTLRAAGVPEWKIHYVFALKAAMAPILTLEGFTFGILVGSLVVVEDVFSLPGLGRGILTSIGNRDYPVLLPQAMILAATFIIANLMVDIIIHIGDPRVRRE